MKSLEFQNFDLAETNDESEENRGIENASFNQLKKVLEKEGIVSDLDLKDSLKNLEGRDINVFYHALNKAVFEQIDPDYFDQDEIILSSGHFSYKADNLSYGHHDFRNVIELRVVDTNGELVDTSKTGEGGEEGHEAIAMRPLVLTKIKDEYLDIEDMVRQSGLAKGYYESDVEKVRQITCLINEQATEEQDFEFLLRDELFALKYLKDHIQESLARPSSFMDSESFKELSRVFKVNTVLFDKNERLRSEFRRTIISFCGWMDSLLSQQRQVVRVTAEEGISWQEKTKLLAREVFEDEAMVRIYMEEYLPHLLTEGGLFELKEGELEELKKEELQRIAEVKQV